VRRFYLLRRFFARPGSVCLRPPSFTPPLNYSSPANPQRCKRYTEKQQPEPYRICMGAEALLLFLLAKRVLLLHDTLNDSLAQNAANLGQSGRLFFHQSQVVGSRSSEEDGAHPGPPGQAPNECGTFAECVGPCSRTHDYGQSSPSSHWSAKTA